MNLPLDIYNARCKSRLPHQFAKSRAAPISQQMTRDFFTFHKRAVARREGNWTFFLSLSLFRVALRSFVATLAQRKRARARGIRRREGEPF